MWKFLWRFYDMSNINGFLDPLSYPFWKRIIYDVCRGEIAFYPVSYIAKGKLHYFFLQLVCTISFSPSYLEVTISGRVVFAWVFIPKAYRACLTHVCSRWLWENVPRPKCIYFMRHGTIFITVEITHFVRIAIFPAPLSIKHQYMYNIN